MTGRQLYEKSLSLISETTDTAGFPDAQVISLINFVLFECFKINNSIRASKDLEKFAAPQQITAMTDTLTYDDDLTLIVIPYGLVSKLLESDDEIDKSNHFQEIYANYLNDSEKVEIMVVTL